MASKEFRDWAEKLARKAIQHQDMTFREMVVKKIIPSWPEYILTLKKEST